MMMSTYPVVRRLRRDQFLRFEHPRGLRLRAEQGDLWITVDGELDDILLAAGTCRTFDGDRPVLVGTFREDAVVSAAAPRCVPGWHRWRRPDASRPMEAA